MQKLRGLLASYECRIWSSQRRPIDGFRKPLSYALSPIPIRLRPASILDASRRRTFEIEIMLSSASDVFARVWTWFDDSITAERALAPSERGRCQGVLYVQIGQFNQEAP